jgi:hypothetical protein
MSSLEIFAVVVAKGTPILGKIIARRRGTVCCMSCTKKIWA